MKTLVLCRCPSVSPVTGAKAGNKTAALIFPYAHASEIEGMGGWTKESPLHPCVYIKIFIHFMAASPPLAVISLKGLFVLLHTLDLWNLFPKK